MVNSSSQGPGTVTSVNPNVGVPPQLSDPVGLPVAAGSVLEPKSTVMSAGHVITGGVLSNTVITCVHDVELPQASDARYVLVKVNLLVHV